MKNVEHSTQYGCYLLADVISSIIAIHDGWLEIETKSGEKHNVSLDRSTTNCGTFDWSTQDGQEKYLRYLVVRYSDSKKKKKIRRRIEDALRKTTDCGAVADCAAALNIKLS